MTKGLPLAVAVWLVPLCAACGRTEPSPPHEPASAPESAPLVRRAGGGPLNPLVENIAIDPEPPEGLGGTAGSLAAAAHTTASATVAFDSNERIYGGALRSNADAQFSIADSEGQLLPLVNFRSNPISSTEILEAFVLEAPPRGSITVTLDAGSSDAQLGYSFAFTNGRLMLVSASPFQAEPGSPIQIVARIVGVDGEVVVGGTASFTGTVGRGGGLTESVSLLDDGSHGDGVAGDGIFGGEYAGTARPGRYSVAVAGTHRVGSEDVERDGIGFFIVAATGDASFSGDLTETPIDADGDGLYDLLRFEHPISFAGNGVFLVIADFVDSEGTVIDTLRWGYTNTEGATSRSAELNVDGPVLVRHDKEGPWKLSDVRIVREDVGSLEVAKRPAHVTDIYPLSMFERPPPPRFIMFVPGRGSCEGHYEVTLMGDGLFDTTEVSVGRSSASFQVRDDATLGVIVPPLKRSISELLPVDVKVTTRWGECVARDAFYYEP